MLQEKEPPRLENVREAAERLKGLAVRTPLLESPRLNEAVGGRLLIKPEVLQRTGSFKFRGAYNRMSQIPAEDRPRGVVAFSSGNHAQGVAAAAHLLGMPATIVMPEDAPAAKREGTAAWGAEIVSYPRRQQEAREAIAERILAERGGTLVRPFDDAGVIAGQGTVGLELLEQAAAGGCRLDAVLVPCSGGGLSAGIATAVSGLSQETAVYTVEPEAWDDMARSLSAGTPQENSGNEPSICDALMAPRPGALTFAINSRLAAGGLTASEAQVIAAMRAAFQHLKLVVEPGGAVALAAALAGALPCRGRTVAVVLSGGNVDLDSFHRLLAGSSPDDRSH